MNTQDVLTAFEILSGLDETKASQYTDLISLAIYEVRSRLKNDVDISSHSLILTQLAAAIAYTNYLGGFASQESSISTLDISVSSNNSKTLNMANSYKQSLLVLAKDLLKDDFLFEAI